VLDGYRWEDLNGRFATVKLSASAEAAIGRVVSRYRLRTIAGNGGTSLSLIDAIKRSLSHAPDRGPAMPEPNRIPPSYFEDAYLMHLPHSDDVEFVDLEHARTHHLLQETAGTLLAAFGVTPVDGKISSNRDRRVTRLVTSALQRWCSEEPGYEHVTGLRYRGADEGWDAYVVWERSSLPLDEGTLEPLHPCDPRVRAAAAHLGLEDPCHSAVAGGT
jgi:hypothetical protein